jgi:hypothetical protein
MFPTSSSTFLVGRNARSAVVLIKLAVAYVTGIRGPNGNRFRSLRALICSAVVSGRRACRRRALPVALASWCWVLTACGSGARQDANEPSGHFPVQILAARFPASQRLAQRIDLVIAVRNSGDQTIPNIAVTITNPLYGTAVQAFSTYLAQPGLANHSRPVWIIIRPPGPCGFSCKSYGLGSAVTAYSNTWALGALHPGAVARFDWRLAAVKSGRYLVRYQIAAGLNGKAVAVRADGSRPAGTFVVTIRRAPPQLYVQPNGEVVTTS